MKLLIDVGNTALKAALSNDGNITSCNLASVAWDQISEVIYACVGNSEQLDTLLNHAMAQNIPSYEASVSKQLESLTCAYSQYQNLGIDRWLAIIAAYKLWPQQDCIIVDTGTATTIDVLNAKGQHLGGWIIPGLDLMTQSLTQNTQRVFDDDATPFSCELGINTPNGLKNGALVATVGAIEQAKLHLTNKKPQLILAGGYAKLLQKELPEAIYAAQLVMQGLNFWRELSEK
ncbi:type III pantothenate kinase [Pseudoalteromonas shioyasakiensis]|uniref:type III pantothenate kinase n=1 Tax=Pseudoalteromonas shioyasakiensis TaxID=1190813 RepID=UPI002117C7DD|nr:type III pantothenate kinase [Pseudoalteromonas shioyasakiensis]MCQ8880123.1 type III pantothenate kinase [Pseudoalteromonas shioyasakiensis]